MSSTYYANATVPSAPEAAGWKAISTISNGAPTQVVVDSHGFSSGDCVEIVGCNGGLTPGVYQITVIDVNTFSLNGTSAVAGTGSGTGNVRDYAVDPMLTLASDGDAGTVASVNSPIEALSNAVPWLYLRTGQYRLVGMYKADNTLLGQPWVANGTLVTVANFNTWYDLSGDVFSGTWSSYGNPAGLLVGDVLEVEASAQMMAHYASPQVPYGPAGTGGTAYDTQMSVGIAVSGGSVTVSPVFPASLNLAQQETLSGDVWSFVPTTRMQYVYTAAAAQTSFGVHLMTQIWTSGGGSLGGVVKHTMAGVWQVNVRHYRLN